MDLVAAPRSGEPTCSLVECPCDSFAAHVRGPLYYRRPSRQAKKFSEHIRIPVAVHCLSTEFQFPAASVLPAERRQRRGDAVCMVEGIAAVHSGLSASIAGPRESTAGTSFEPAAAFDYSPRRCDRTDVGRSLR